MTRRTPLFGFLVGYLVSEIGTSMSAVAIPWLVLVTTGSAAQTGVVAFAQMAPFIVLQATGGPLADRFGYRRANVLGNLGAALALGAVPALHAVGALHFSGIAGLVAVAGAARGLADAASNPLIPALGTRAGMPLERVAGLFSAANRTGLLIGMPAGGVLIGVFGAANVVLFDAVSFGAVALSVLVVVPATLGIVETSEPMSVRAYRRQLMEGLRFLLQDRLLLGMVSLIAVTNLLDEAFSSVLLPVWARTRVHDAAAMGAVGGAGGLGLLGGVLLGAWLGPRLPRHTTFATGYLLGAFPPFVVLAFTTSLSVVLPVMVFSGIAGGVLNPINGAVLYERVPPHLQARVLGAVKASAWVGIPFGSLIGGALTAGAGLTAALLGCGAVMFLTTLTPFVFPVWRTMDHAPDSAPVGVTSVSPARSEGHNHAVHF